MPSPNRPNSGRADSKYFIGPLKAKKKFIILNHFNVKFYFSNACLNSVEHILFPSKQKFKRTGAWFQVSKRFVFSLSPLNIEHLLLTMLKRLLFKVNNHRTLILFYCITSFCNIKFLKYLPLGIFYLELYSSFY